MFVMDVGETERILLFCNILHSVKVNTKLIDSGDKKFWTHIKDRCTVHVLSISYEIAIQWMP